MLYMKVILLGVCLGGLVTAQPVRVADHHRYELLDTTGFYLYSLRKLAQGEKISRVETVYYLGMYKVKWLYGLCRKE